MASIIDPNNCSVLHLRGKLKEPAVVSRKGWGWRFEVQVQGFVSRFTLSRTYVQTVPREEGEECSTRIIFENSTGLCFTVKNTH